MIEAEIDSHIGYEKSKRSDDDDYRNRFKRKQADSRVNGQYDKIRLDTFYESAISGKEQQNVCGLESHYSPLYNEKTFIGRLHSYFAHYFDKFSAPTADTLFLLVLSMLAMESADSICSLYRHFLSGITKKSLNVFYYACSYAKADCSKSAHAATSMALN